MTILPGTGRGAAREARGGGGEQRTLRPEVAVARKQRREMSYPEVLLWQRLRGEAVRLRRQHPIGLYTVDFYCAAATLVIEVDGEIHSRPEAIARDAHRDRFLAENGYRVLHIKAADIPRNADQVAASIASLVASPLHHRPAAGGPPFPCRGGSGTSMNVRPALSYTPNFRHTEAQSSPRMLRRWRKTRDRLNFLNIRVA